MSNIVHSKRTPLWKKRPASDYVSTTIMDNLEPLEPYRFSGLKNDLLNECFTDTPAPMPILQTYRRRPMPSKMRISIEGKGRGVVAARDIKAGKVILQESPVLVMPYGEFMPPLLLLLPREASEAILLLHNAQPGETPITDAEDNTHHRLLDTLMAVVNTNLFEGEASFGKIGMVLLTGSIFNHESNPNVRRY
ncbi:hypothetical protein G6011_02393 [Alternaria panax]|uniref:SET domain-containing protein n=1 Tax=Alternaria panax TaxID=48097 RepID=A0AAD4FED5_9PLEO|nr:hypothetical protein G6011_02393 [Alternaria panax]